MRIKCLYSFAHRIEESVLFCGQIGQKQKSKINQVKKQMAKGLKFITTAKDYDHLEDMSIALINFKPKISLDPLFSISVKPSTL